MLLVNCIPMNTDPIADLLTRLRNASRARHEQTTVPASRLKKAILEVLKRKGTIRDFHEVKGESIQAAFSIMLDPEKEIAVKRISKPGQRMYHKKTAMNRVLRGYGFSIISTSSGIMTGDEAKKKGVGGEVICEVF